MVKKYQIPVIDEHNPFYCPSVSPSSYLATLHKSLSKSNVSENNVSLFSFGRILDQKFFEVDEEDRTPYYYQDHRVARYRKPVSLPPAYSPPSWETRHPPAYPPRLAPVKHEQNIAALDPPGHALKRKRSSSSNTFSDLEGPTKRGRSSESIHQSSFDVSGKGERIFGSHFYDRSSAFGSIYAPILVPSEIDTKSSGNENVLLTRIRVLEGTIVDLNASLCCCL